MTDFDDIDADEAYEIRQRSRAEDSEPNWATLADQPDLAPTLAPGGGTLPGDDQNRL